MKPDWKGAPKWANWLAMDKNGEWYWYKNKPEAEARRWCSDTTYERIYALPGWQDTLEERPKPEPRYMVLDPSSGSTFWRVMNAETHSYLAHLATKQQADVVAAALNELEG